MNELNILYLYPDILELYGDFGNIQVLKYRLEKRGIKANITPYSIGNDAPNLSNYDLIFKMLKINADMIVHKSNKNKLNVKYQDYDLDIYYEIVLSKEDLELKQKQIESLKQSIE